MKRKFIFSKDQIICSADVITSFGDVQEFAQKKPLLIVDERGNAKTVLFSYELFESLYARLAELEEARESRILHQRLEDVKKDPIDSTVPWKTVRKTDG